MNSYTYKVGGYSSDTPYELSWEKNQGTYSKMYYYMYYISHNSL